MGLCPHVWLLNWATVNGGEKGLKEEDKEGLGDREAARPAWGLLGPTEGIVICNIHSNVPYQMQWVRRCSRMEISLVPHSALVTPRANSDKWIYSDNTYGALTIQKVAWKAETVEGSEAERFMPQYTIQPALTLFSCNNKQLSAFYFHIAFTFHFNFMYIF